MSTAARGYSGPSEPLPPDWDPELNFGVPARLPAAYVADDETRLNLYARLVRLRSIEAIDEFAEEIEDRFGAPPDEVSCLIELARLAERCRALAVVKIDAGPQAIALTFRHDAVTSRLEHVDERLCWRGERLVFAQPTEDAGQRLHEASLLLRQLSRRRRR